MKLDEAAEFLLKNASDDDKKNALKFVLDSNTEVFDFGKINLDFIYDNAKLASEFLKAKVFQFPFDNCAYKLSVPYENYFIECFFFLFNFNGDETGFACCSRRLGFNPICYSFMIKGEEISGEVFFDTKNTKNTQSEEDFLVQSATIMLGLTMILLTKNVPKTRVAPDEKLNKARIKNGKRPLTYVTTIDMRAYYEAAENTRRGTIGTRSSPRPHLRRAHLRHITVDGVLKVIPIHAMMINWDGKEPLGREEYKVLT